MQEGSSVVNFHAYSVKAQAMPGSHTKPVSSLFLLLPFMLSLKNTMRKLGIQGEIVLHVTLVVENQ